MSNIGTYLRLLIPSDKEGSVERVTTEGSIVNEFETNLQTGQPRRYFTIYNNTNESNSSSGECYYGFSGEQMTPDVASQPIPQGAMVQLPLATDVSIYFCGVAGVSGELVVTELA